MNDANHDKLVNFHSVGDHVISDSAEAVVGIRHIRSSVTQARKIGEQMNRLVDFFVDAICSRRIIPRDPITDAFDIAIRFASDTVIHASRFRT